MADKGTDPMVLWQKKIAEMEKEINSFANLAMGSPEFSKLVNQAGGVTAYAQKQFGDFMGKYLLTMNLPSREQVVGIAERLQTIESQVHEIKALLHQMQANAGGPQADTSGIVRPPRTKRPPEPSSGERT